MMKSRSQLYKSVKANKAGSWIISDGFTRYILGYFFLFDKIGDVKLKLICCKRKGKFIIN